MRQLLVAGGGIGGLAAALAAARAGWQAQVLEQAAQFTEVGAGLQLGPNATRRLAQWGLLDAVRALACAPEALVARDARTGGELARLPLGDEAVARYGAPYLTVHRTDLHAVLLQALRGREVSLAAGCRITGWDDGEAGLGGRQGTGGGADGVSSVAVRLAPSAPAATAVLGTLAGPAAREPSPVAVAGDALIGADGLWSVIRQRLLADGAAQPSDHVAYRGLVPLAGAVPGGAQVAREVTAWLGPRLHAVTYPVRGGRALNVVCVVHQAIDGPTQGWDLPGTREALLAATGAIEGPLREILMAVPAWGRWVLHDRPPVAGPEQMARGAVALLGDAAHPMRPYLAQGAAMALEDADELGRALRLVTDRITDAPQALQRYALARWQRVAQVQRRSLRNGAIFHATGPVRLGRDLALRSLGAQLMDLPWLYGG